MKYVNGDLFTSEFKYIAHGCNTKGVMGSGFAKIIKQKYPGAYLKYNRFCEPYLGYSYDALGKTVEYVDEETNVTIFNMITQANFGSNPDVRYVSYDAIADCFDFVNKNYPGIDLAIPKIGAGLGNGNWDIIEKIIEGSSPKLNITVFVL